MEGLVKILNIKESNYTNSITSIFLKGKANKIMINLLNILNLSENNVNSERGGKCVNI